VKKALTMMGKLCLIWHKVTSHQRPLLPIKRYGEEPLKYASKLTDPRLGTYRFRIGDYRVIFDLEGEEIVVLRVGHRRDIYRKF